MEIDTTLVPYLVKKFKILSIKSVKKDTDESIDVLYVNELTKDDIETLEGFIEKKVNFVRKLEEQEFWEIASEFYEDVSFVGIENDKEKKYNAAKYIKENNIEPEPEPEPEPEHGEKVNYADTVNLSEIPIDYLIKEIRSRQIKTEAEAVIHITEDRNANFEFTKLSWPIGKFKVSMNIIEELEYMDNNSENIRKENNE